jgi:transcriptional regulator with PAS, ATPase and Fis domain
MTKVPLDQLIIGTSPAMQELRDAVRRAAVRAGPVLIQGPTGAGKELVANGLHVESGRRGRFVACNAAAIPEGLFESEIMGHVRGAFTGAMRDREGLVRRANHGTLFLDEIGDLHVPAQAKLLRVIDTREVWPVGADSGEKVDFRLVAATNVNLAMAENLGRFRADLRFRLRGLVINVPPLRDHLEDIGGLAAHFAITMAKESNSTLALTTKAVKQLEQYDWPGNVRELRQTIERASFLADGSSITDVHVAHALADNCFSSVGGLSAPDMLHRRELISLLVRHAGNVDAVAMALGVTRSATYRRMHRLGVAVPRRGPRLRPIVDGAIERCVEDCITISDNAVRI